MQYNDERLRCVVEISALVTQSNNFFEIKDKIIEKMLEVVHPTKACVNLFYKNNYKHAYLVCSETLDYISELYPMEYPRGVKIDFNEYPIYVREAVRERKIIYIENVFEDERAEAERELAKEEGYIGRIVFPLMINEKVIGFMTCFLTEEDSLDNDIDFISSVASLISLSIEVTTKNNDIQMLINKLRGAIASINEATKKLYLNKDITSFLDHLSKQACNITKSKEALIIIDDEENKRQQFSSYSTNSEKNIDIYSILNEIVKCDSIGKFNNELGYIYYKLKQKEKVVGYIICINSEKYTNDDLSILSVLVKQVSVAMQLYEYNQNEVKHQVLENELNLLSKQQKLIMNKGNKELSNNKELYYYHQPARVVGGDFYHAIKKDEDKIVTILADVMGHGMVSNYVVAMIKGAFKVLAKQFETPSEIMNNLNKFLFDEFDEMGVFTTCIISVIDSKNNTMTLSNAGHYYPIGVKKDKSSNFIQCVKGIPIGILEDAKYSEVEVDISDYRLISMYTDGILEINNENKEEFGVDRLKNFLTKNTDLNKLELITSLKSELWNFSKKSNFQDDILIVTLKDN
ncbi:MAG: SpoIIE family protein phosphatase [Peptostreptococcaceae bacterium]|nr:SpoIIE family protein phosphatase [Peptostreptococcaceae bacterium]